MLTAQSCAIGRQVPENDSLEIMHNITTRPPDPNDCFLGHPVMPYCTKMLKFKK